MVLNYVSRDHIPNRVISVMLFLFSDVPKLAAVPVILVFKGLKLPFRTEDFCQIPFRAGTSEKVFFTIS